MLSAIGRGRHRLVDPPPWVLDDPFALPLVGPAWLEINAASSVALREPLLDGVRAFLVGRSRYAEDRLAAGDFTQYVILGAGLDSFAWRRPDLLHSLRVFEIDHPSMQAWKLERAAVLALPTNDKHILAPVDFETETLRDGLGGVGFDWSQPTLFSWLGVTMYLTSDAIKDTLATVASCVAGSEIVLSYPPTLPFLDDLGKEFLEVLKRTAAGAGEPILTALRPTDAVAMLEGCGLQVAEELSRDDLHERYFAGRTDNLTPHTVERLIAAVVQA